MDGVLQAQKSPRDGVSEGADRMGVCGLVYVDNRRSVGNAQAVEAEGVVGVGMVGHEDQHSEVVGEDVGQLEP